MHLKISVNLGNYEHFSPCSNEHDTLTECAHELISELSKIKSYDIEQYIINYLIPIIYDPPMDPKEFKQKYNHLLSIEERIKEKEAYLGQIERHAKFVEQELTDLIEKVRIESKKLNELEVEG